MESFYRAMRKKHNVLMEGDKPLTGQWNYDDENRKKLPKDHKPTPPLVFNNDTAVEITFGNSFSVILSIILSAVCLLGIS